MYFFGHDFEIIVMSLPFLCHILSYRFREILHRSTADTDELTALPFSCHVLSYLFMQVLYRENQKIWTVLPDLFLSYTWIMMQNIDKFKHSTLINRVNIDNKKARAN